MANPATSPLPIATTTVAIFDQGAGGRLLVALAEGGQAAELVGQALVDLAEADLGVGYLISGGAGDRLVGDRLPQRLAQGLDGAGRTGGLGSSSRSATCCCATSRS